MAEKKFQVYIDPKNDKIFVVNVNNNHWILLTNIDPIEQEVQTSMESNEHLETSRKNWFIYDSLNLQEEGEDYDDNQKRFKENEGLSETDTNKSSGGSTVWRTLATAIPQILLVWPHHTYIFQK
ncbi:unnamed protein product [Brachionus calyciflorus]|uniref:Uncharacterized protein n=1 Tax=Brachionus calyciflorus TaxID=104777 RepID=A0A813T7Y6_9BILA|nr:unnamed protein product [Brachionus calyciflorus]